MLDSKRNRIGVKGQALQFTFVLILMAAIFASARSTIAGSASAPLAITATVMRTCWLSASALALRDYEPVVNNANTDLTAGANVTVVCTGGSNPTIAIGAGSYTSGTVILPAMSNRGDGSSYEIYKDSRLTQVGAESGSSVSNGTFPSMRDQTVPVRGRIPAVQNAPVGSYNDAVTVIVNF